jgi:hypothetical protein
MPYCPNCGKEVDKAHIFCSGCGEPLQPDGQEGQISGENSHRTSATGPTGGRESDRTDDKMFYIGAVLGVAGVLLFPYFFFLIALPEAIIQYWGRSIQDSLPENARDNPAVAGTFLIFRWFGNFLLLIIVLGILAGIFLIAT